MFRELLSGISTILGGESPSHGSAPQRLGVEPGESSEYFDIQGLPDGVILQIVKLVDKDSIGNMRLVCTSWYRLSHLLIKNLSPKVLKKGIVRGKNNSFHGLETLDLSMATGVTDQKLGLLPELKNLRYLKLKRCRDISDTGVVHLAKLDRLEMLNLARCLNISDEGIAMLVTGAQCLKSLNIKYNYKITNKGILELGRLKSLTSLNCSHCRHVSDVGMHGLLGLERLEVLKFNNCDQITDYGMELLGNLSSLRVLRASIERTFQQQKTDASLQVIGEKLVNISALKYTLGENVSIDGVQRIATLPAIKELRLGRVFVPMDEVLKALGNTATLEVLRLDGCGDIGEEGMKNLAKLVNLRVLSLGARSEANTIDDAGMELLADLENLEVLRVARYGSFKGTSLGSLVNLKKLDLVNCNSVEHDALVNLGRLKDLKCLCLSSNSNVTDDAIVAFAGLDALESLTLCECINVSGATIGALSTVETLKKLTLSFCGKLHDEGMEQISMVSSLNDVNVSMCTHITDRGILALAKPSMENLKQLNIAGCDLVTQPARNMLQEKLEGLVIERKRFHPTLIHVLGNDLYGE